MGQQGFPWSPESEGMLFLLTGGAVGTLRGQDCAAGGRGFTVRHFSEVTGRSQGLLS